MLEIVEKFLKLNLVLRPEYFQQNFRKQIQLCVSGVLKTFALGYSNMS